MSIKKLSFVDNKSINAIALGGAVLGSGGGGDRGWCPCPGCTRRVW